MFSVRTETVPTLLTRGVEYVTSPRKIYIIHDVLSPNRYTISETEPAFEKLCLVRTTKTMDKVQKPSNNNLKFIQTVVDTEGNRAPWMQVCHYFYWKYPTSTFNLTASLFNTTLKQRLILWFHVKFYLLFQILIYFESDHIYEKYCGVSLSFDLF
jgi:hypothetical protein